MRTPPRPTSSARLIALPAPPLLQHISDTAPAMAEIEFPFMPTPPAFQREALITYLEGERLCDAGQYKEGVALLKKATRMAWELEWERWPGWAEALHSELVRGLEWDLNPSPRPHLALPPRSERLQLIHEGGLSLMLAVGQRHRKAA